MPVGKRITPMKKSPMKLDPLTIMAIASIVGSGVEAYGNYRSANRQLKAQERAEARSAANYQKNVKALQDMEVSNPFANIQTQFENPFEDITVNQQAAQFASQQAAQSRANIMDQFRGAAGSSGIAGLAQAMANQATMQNARAAASIGQQESRNQALMAQGALRVSAMEQQAEQRVAYGDYLREQNENQRALNIMNLRAGREAALTQFDMNRELLKGQKTQAITSFIGSAAGTAYDYYDAGGKFGLGKRESNPAGPSTSTFELLNPIVEQQIGETPISQFNINDIIQPNAFRTPGTSFDLHIIPVNQFNYADSYDKGQLSQRRKEMRAENNYDYRSGGEAAYRQNLINQAYGDPTRYDI